MERPTFFLGTQSTAVFSSEAVAVAGVCSPDGALETTKGGFGPECVGEIPRSPACAVFHVGVWFDEVPHFLRFLSLGVFHFQTNLHFTSLAHIGDAAV